MVIMGIMGGGGRAVPGRHSHGVQVQNRNRVTSSARSHAVSTAERYNCRKCQHQRGRGKSQSANSTIAER